MPESMRNTLVTVFGGDGFVGRHIVRELAKRGFRIRVAVRRPDLAVHLQPLGGVGQIHAVQANLRNGDSVRRAVDGAATVINLVGILSSRGKQTFKSVHSEGAHRVAKAAAEAGAKRLIHISAIGADPSAKAQYARSKALGEEAVFTEYPDAIVMRPSIIFGPEDGFFNKFAALARISPVLPLIGGGKTRFQPVYVGDVAEAVALAAEGRAQPGRVYELGGPAVLTFKELMQKVLAYSDRHCMLVPWPFWIMKFQAFFLQLLPWPILTVDQVRLLQSDSVVSQVAIDEGLTLSGLGIGRPHAIETIVPHYLERFRSKGQFSVVRG